MRIALGAQAKGLYGDYLYAYRYAEQAGTYKIIELLGIVIRHDPFRLFSSVTIFACAVFLLLSSYFLKRITGASYLVGFSALLLFQETWVSSYYPNSTVLAAAVLSIALLLITWKDNIVCIVLAALLFAIAFWIRLDALLLGGAFVITLFYSRNRRIRGIFVFIVTSIVVATILFISSGNSIQDMFKGYSAHAQNANDLKATLNNYSTVFTLVTVFFCGFGLYKLFRAKEWYLIILSLVGSIPLILAYGISLLSPKYLLYAIIFISIPLTYALKSLTEDRSRNAERLLFVGIVLFVGQYVFSPAYELILNRSTIVYTADEGRLRGAIAYTPIYWAKYRREKSSQDLIFQTRLNEYLQKESRAYIISHDWMTNQWLLYYFQNSDYRITESDNYAEILEDGQRLVLKKGSSIIYLVRWHPETSLDLPSSLREEIEAMPSVLYIGPDYTTTDYAQKSFLSDKFSWQRLSDWGRFEVILFQK